ncbi:MULTISPECIES: hypothetical protein [Paenibacillus]|uniref:IS66 family insertion sequence element accessory protein TnpA n=1 Tax=Paenibacillus TaxID=44249 RepID=UPI0008E68D27|nr:MULTISPECIES: hypothetical protein [Paenibacillus]OZQ57311.1 hypothetical protein CA599_31905 [Paenibacillus taichungensis]SFT00593.1 hypothetical protein SAMN04488601_11920 [Paenibacillus sp. 453mf]
MAREDVQEKWEARIAAFRSSGEKAIKWCKDNQVNRRHLYAWLKRLSSSSSDANSTKSTTFVKANVTPESKPTPSACPLCIRIGTAVIEVEPGFNPALLRDVVQALEAEC